MALSDYEKQVLAEMEQELRKQDPGLADAMASSLPKKERVVPEAPAKAPLSPRRIAVGSILVAVGLAIVLAGMSFAFSVWTAILGALGFAAMVGGILYALSSDKDAKVDKPSRGQQEMTSASRRDKEEERRRRWENRGSS